MKLRTQLIRLKLTKKRKIVIKRYVVIILLFVGFVHVNAQIITKEELTELTRKLDSLEKHIPALIKKVNFTINNSEFPTFIRAVAIAHKLNISIDPSLKNIIVSQNFSNVSVKDVLIFSAQKYNLEIKIFGSILTISKKKAPKVIPKELVIAYNSSTDLLTVDLQNDPLTTVFKRITNLTGKNLFFYPGLSNQKLSVYIKSMPLQIALDKLALANDLFLTKTKDGVFQFSKNIKNTSTKSKPQRNLRYKKANFYFEVKDTLNKIITVDFENISIATIVNEIGMDVKANMFTAFSLKEMGTVSFKANNIHFDTLLDNLFEKDAVYSYKKENNIYFFGKREQNTLRSTVTIPLIHRSIQIMDEQTNSQSNFNQNNSSSQNGLNNSNGRYGNQNARQQPTISPRGNVNQSKTKTENLIDIIPKEIKEQLQIQSDVEQNSFIVSGPSQQIEKFRKFIKLIDKPIPVITIDVMILEVSKSSSVSTGISMGIGSSPTKTSGGVFPNTNLTLGATSINKIIEGFNGFGSLNLGKVTPNFFAKIEALETNGDLNIKSTPRITALNGHEAMLSNGERSYYAVTTTDIIGTQNPQTREIKNYFPIDANLSIKIRPIVSGDGQITLSIKVIQSSFNGKQIDPDAPPGINSREFTSTIRVKNQDVVVLGGLEENLKNDSGSGVPFLARIPIIKYLFSKRTRTASKTKLTVLIKPTIYK